MNVTSYSFVSGPDQTSAYCVWKVGQILATGTQAIAGNGDHTMGGEGEGKN